MNRPPTELEGTTVVILAGGRGKRLWPLSTPERPKQFLDLTGSGRSMLQETVDRALQLVPVENLLIVCPHVQERGVKEQVPQVRIVAEPAGRNTAAAIALAAADLEHTAPGGVMVVLSSDHVILNPDHWLTAIRAGALHARESGRLVTFGIRFEEPEPRFGYIVAGDLLDETKQTPVRAVERFVEKPSRPDLEQLMQTKRCFRNSGMFAWKSDVILEELGFHLPRTHQAALEAIGGEATAFGDLEPISVDHGILQLSSRVSVVETNIERLDLGDLRALHGIWPHDEAGNASVTPLTAVDSHGNTVHTEQGRVALVGVDDLVIAVTPDAVLVCKADRTQEIRALVSRIENSTPET